LGQHRILTNHALHRDEPGGGVVIAYHALDRGEFGGAWRLRLLNSDL
jgi:hypothetical protein